MVVPEIITGGPFIQRDNQSVTPLAPKSDLGAGTAIVEPQESTHICEMPKHTRPPTFPSSSEDGGVTPHPASPCTSPDHVVI